MTQHDLLVASLNHLERVGWTQGDQSYSSGPCRPTCAFGAPYFAFGFERPSDALGAPADRIIVSVHSALNRQGCNPEWNDAPERTFADVKAAYCRAIEATAPAEAPTFDLRTGELVS